VTEALALLRRETELALALLGCRSPADLRRSHVLG
jgi:isopentenyl diphosphate isomerase/L-lactate dehydrogenase-like FMN-dependent dehydrogenase